MSYVFPLVKYVNFMLWFSQLGVVVIVVVFVFLCSIFNLTMQISGIVPAVTDIGDVWRFSALVSSPSWIEGLC